MICLEIIFNFIILSALAKRLYETKDAKKNNGLIEEIKKR